MIIDTNKLPKDERTYLEMQALFEASGYRLFRMRKFEEYAFYLENKSFLNSEFVLTFNGAGGKLMALKPDVTMSIVKNARAAGRAREKVYYRESVYRMDQAIGEFREINQMGLECIGDVDSAATSQICLLAVQSLKSIDGDFIFAVSHMSFIAGLLDLCGVGAGSLREKILNLIRSKNVHGIESLSLNGELDAEAAAKLCAVAGAPTDFEEALKVASSLAANRAMSAATEELENLYSLVGETGYADKVRLDFSVINDIDYYNGVIFQGFVKRIPRAVLSGGRYDRLLGKTDGNLGAMGFAVSLSELPAYYPRSVGSEGVWSV